MCELFLPIVKSRILNCTSMAGKFNGIKNDKLAKNLKSLKNPGELISFYEEFLLRVAEGTSEQHGWTS